MASPSRGTAIGLLAVLGIFGAHHFYLGRTGYGFLCLITLNFILLGWIYDFTRINALVEEAQRHEGPKEDNRGAGGLINNDLKEPLTAGFPSAERLDDHEGFEDMPPPPPSPPAPPARLGIPSEIRAEIRGAQPQQPSPSAAPSAAPAPQARPVAAASGIGSQDVEVNFAKGSREAASREGLDDAGNGASTGSEGAESQEDDHDGGSEEDDGGDDDDMMMHAKPKEANEEPKDESQMTEEELVSAPTPPRSFPQLQVCNSLYAYRSASGKKKRSVACI